jgi:hypothetical protein
VNKYWEEADGHVTEMVHPCGVGNFHRSVQSRKYCKYTGRSDIYANAIEISPICDT